VNRLPLWLGAALVCALHSSAQSSQDLNSLTLEELMQVKVEGAALHSQTLEDAPASVTIITAEDIRKYGYRTLGEALASVRGFYLESNRTYETVGVRGFNLPGDYSSHVMVMVNGHNMADNVLDFMVYYGNDFPIDMNLVKQIEIIRGPASALYGSNAMFATVNIITKAPGDAGPLTFTGDVGSYGEKKGQLTETVSIAGMKALFSASVMNANGQSPIFFPQFDTPPTNYGNAIDMNAEQAYHFFGSVTWRNWTVTSAFAGHDIVQPVSFGNTIFNDRGTAAGDNRDFIEAAYTRQIAGGTLRWRTYYDSYHFLGREDFALPDGGIEDNRSSLWGNWIGSQLTYRWRPIPLGEITAGLEAKFDIRNLQEDYDVSPVPVQYLKTSNPDRNLALILQDEKTLSRRWKLDLGLRFDYSAYRQGFVSPRAALIYQRSAWTYKFLYGRSFRNPSAFQLFYSDGLADAANPSARAESADTFEADLEHKLSKRLTLLISAYGYELRDFLVGEYLPNGLLQYQNDGRIRAEGLELEINGHPENWLEMTASYAVQRARDNSSEGVLANSPDYLGKLRLAVPLGRRFDLSGGMQYEGRRDTSADATLPSAYLADFTLTSKRLLSNFDIRLGLRNAFNLRYSEPVALNPTVDSMPQPGRTFFVELIAHARR
jgi:outer membrane receptor protein involved in Fe transport